TAAGPAAAAAPQPSPRATSAGADTARPATGDVDAPRAGVDALLARPDASTPDPAPAAADTPPPSGGSSRPAAARAARPPIKKPGAFPVIAGSCGLFFAILALLGFQMRAGKDPAIGKGEPVQLAAATPQPRQIIRRRVIITRIVEHRPRRAPATSAPATGGGSAPASPSAPATSAPAP
ncbi:hypothetical protein OJ962_34310, partial [Solirubrobacter sp. CPCC 204708]|nr:hypothetical protein [Solirubrobacter deserti]